MDKALVDSLDSFIFKLQKASDNLKASRTDEFRKAKRNNAAIALKSSADFLSYCALVALFRRNIGHLSEPSCVAVFSVPSNWRLADMDEAAKIILKSQKGVKICLHPTSKHRRGWEIDAEELLESGDKLVIFTQEGTVLHEDLELAATLVDRVRLCEPRHLRALSKFRSCGDLSDEQVAIVAQQPSERMEAIFRRGQPVARAASKLKAAMRLDSSGKARRLDIEKGFGEASIWAKALKQDLEDWRRGNLPWSEIDRGCLFYGPSGTGKTQFTAALAANCGMHLKATSIPEWQSAKDGDLGDMLKAMFQSFASAKENAPSLLFIDEIDAIGDRAKFPARHETYSTTVVNALLECVDGINGREGVVVVGACNFPERIDPALLRSGRLEKHVLFPLPDATARAQILGYHLPTLATDDALQQIAARLPGKSGADLERLAREARRIARNANREVTVNDLKERVQVPPPLDAKTLYRIAVHEAGHALSARALLLGQIEYVEIYDNITSFATHLEAHGITMVDVPASPFVTRWDIMKMITMKLAGAAAEDLVFGHRANWSTGSKESDFASATSLAVQMVTEYGFGNSLYFLPGSVDRSTATRLWDDLPLKDEVSDILQEQYNRAKDMLDGLKPTLLKIADALVQHKRLDKTQLESHWPGAKKAKAVLRN